MSTIFFIAAVLFGIAALVGLEIELVSLSAGCLLAALVCIARLRPGRRFELEDRGINIDNSNSVIGWERISGCGYGRFKIDPQLASGLAEKYITVFYDKKSAVRLRCDAPTNNASFYAALWNFVLSGYQPRLESVLAEALKSAQQKYDATELVAAGNLATFRPGEVQIRPRVVFGFLAFFVSALIGASLANQPGVAIGFATFSGIVTVALTIGAIAQAVKRKNQSLPGGILLTPQQLALQIKDLKGTLKWSELLEISLLPSNLKPVKLRLRVAGVDIVLLDQFQLPLWFLYRHAAKMRDEYKLKFESTLPSSQSHTDVKDIEVEKEDFNPYRPPRYN